jgi:hypothetical protein
MSTSQESSDKAPLVPQKNGRRIGKTESQLQLVATMLATTPHLETSVFSYNFLNFASRVRDYLHELGLKDNIKECNDNRLVLDMTKDPSSPDIRTLTMSVPQSDFHKF